MCGWVVAALAPSVSYAQCVVEGATPIGAAPVGSSERVALTEAVRITLRGSAAAVEGLRPVAFRASVPVADVALYLRAPHATPVVAASAGSQVEASSARGDVVVADLRAGSTLTVGGVSLRCAALTLRAPEGTVAAAPLAPFAEARGYRTESTAREHTVCRTVRGATSCEVVRNRCNPVGDGSVCGYHPQHTSVRVYARPVAGAPSYVLTPLREVVLADEDARPGWLRVVTRTDDPLPVGVRGWVRASDVQWRQDAPSPRRDATVGAMGHAVPAGTRRGFVMLAPDTALTDVHDARWGTVTTAWCTAAWQAPASPRVAVTLPGAHVPLAYVTADHARWVDACPAP